MELNGQRKKSLFKKFSLYPCLEATLFFEEFLLNLMSQKKRTFLAVKTAFYLVLSCENN